jgi:hypothetical protein
MELVCVCGNWFEFPYKNRKQILKEFELFCDCFCVIAYLEQYHSEKKINPLIHKEVNTCILSDPLEYWCPITKRFYRSKSEATAAIFFRTIQVEIEYECFTVSLEGTNLTYSPDFYLPYHDVFVEVKGLWQGSAKKKIKIAKAMGYRLLLVPDYLTRKMEKFNNEIVIL